MIDLMSMGQPPHIAAELNQGGNTAERNLADTKKMHEMMMSKLDQEKADLEKQIADYEKTEQELEKFKDLENLRKLQFQLWQERKSLFSLNEKKRGQLGDMKKQYFHELAKTKAEIDHYNNMKIAQNKYIDQERLKINELNGQMQDLKKFKSKIEDEYGSQGGQHPQQMQYHPDM